MGYLDQVFQVEPQLQKSVPLEGWQFLQNSDVEFMYGEMCRHAELNACDTYLNIFHDFGLRDLSRMLTFSNTRYRGLRGQVVDLKAEGVDSFYQCISQGVFPITPTTRPIEQFENCDEPDALHDMVGHLPYLQDDEVVQLMLGLCHQMSNVTDSSVKKQLMRLWFHIFEFGLVLEKGQLKAFGAGLISSRKAFSSIKEAPVFFASKEAVLNTGISAEGLPHCYFLHQGKAELLDFTRSALTEMVAA